jgi:hypothetical protein
VIRENGDENVWITFPDGSVAQVSKELIEWPSPRTPDVPLKS